MVFNIKYHFLPLVNGEADFFSYHTLRNQLGEQETRELFEFIHSEIKADIETVKANLDIKTNVLLTKEDEIDLINRINITKSDLIDRMDTVKVDLIDRINKVKEV